MSEKYEDMLYLDPLVSKTHRKMSIQDYCHSFL